MIKTQAEAPKLSQNNSKMLLLNDYNKNKCLLIDIPHS
jgi:hypothetical protein